jgi:nitroimidazol reductase NimA-like FMN-containing flavoprotein (pyridoxamine 5'-phosphate oxidase superfamily)
VIDRRIYIHSAREGEKMDAIAADPRVCVEVEIVTENPGDCYRFRSAIGFGNARVVTDRDAKRRALAAIAAKYEPNYPRHDDDDERISIIEIELSEISGKHRV